MALSITLECRGQQTRSIARACQRLAKCPRLKALPQAGHIHPGTEGYTRPSPQNAGRHSSGTTYDPQRLVRSTCLEIVCLHFQQIFGPMPIIVLEGTGIKPVTICRRNGKPTSLGCFDKETEAARAYDKMMIWCELHNSNAVKAGITNFDMSEYEKDITTLNSMSQVLPPTNPLLPSETHHWASLSFGGTKPGGLQAGSFPAAGASPFVLHPEAVHLKVAVKRMNVNGQQPLALCAG